jgi:hypothetical protein
LFLWGESLQKEGSLPVWYCLPGSFILRRL